MRVHSRTLLEGLNLVEWLTNTNFGRHGEIRTHLPGGKRFTGARSSPCPHRAEGVGAPRGIRTHHCLRPERSASYRWATGANVVGLPGLEPGNCWV